jgi:hypothetical protein
MPEASRCVAGVVAGLPRGRELQAKDPRRFELGEPFIFSQCNNPLSLKGRQHCLVEDRIGLHLPESDRNPIQVQAIVNNLQNSFWIEGERHEFTGLNGYARQAVAGGFQHPLRPDPQ